MRPSREPKEEQPYNREKLPGLEISEARVVPGLRKTPLDRHPSFLGRAQLPSTLLQPRDYLQRPRGPLSLFLPQSFSSPSVVQGTSASNLPCQTGAQSLKMQTPRGKDSD